MCAACSPLRLVSSVDEVHGARPGAPAVDIRDPLVDEREQRVMHLDLLVELGCNDSLDRLRVRDVTPHVGGEVHHQRFPRLGDPEIEFVLLDLGLHAADVDEAALA